MSEVYKAITAITGAMSKEGIAKNQKNTQQNYMFRGIDAVYNALSPMLAEHQLCIMPRLVSRECVERMNSKGNALFYVVVEVDFDFVSAKDGSTHTVRMPGEAMDSGDKATNKAMSAAYKYACFQTFCIPTEGDNDADATTHEVSAFITQKQADDLREYAQSLGADIDAFCQYLKIDKIEELPASRYEAANRALDAKKKQKEAADGTAQ